MTQESQPRRQVAVLPEDLADPVSYWQRSAQGFIRHIEGESGGDGRLIRDAVLHPRMLDHLGDVQGQTVLDIGGGDGILSRELTGKGARVVNGDFIFDIVKQTLRTEPRVPSVQLSAAETLPFPNSQFDKAVSNLLLMWLPEVRTIARETYRVLKPGGRLVASITHPMVNLGEFDLSQPDQPMLKLQAPLAGGVWLKMINETNGPYPYYQRSPAEYVNTFTKTGFRLVPGHGYDDVFFPDDFVARHPQYLKHQWYPLFLILSFEK